jgi:hypothetical protein
VTYLIIIICIIREAFFIQDTAALMLTSAVTTFLTVVTRGWVRVLTGTCLRTILWAIRVAVSRAIVLALMVLPA